MDQEDLSPASAGGPDRWEALARYLAGESPPEEAQSVRAWLAEHPGRETQLAALDRAMDRAAPRPSGDVDVEAALARVHGRMDAPAAAPRRAPPPSTRARRWRPTAVRAAAGGLLLLGAYFGGKVVRGSGVAAPPTAFETGIGVRDSLRLPDGTRVLLGPGSRLVLEAGYGERTRDVRLVGEALFDVPHNDARPFTVHAGAARVLDLGTVFSVEADPGAGVRVVVTSGAVALAAGDTEPRNGLVLRAGERGVLPQGGAAAERTRATEDDLAWTRGRLVFRDAPLAQVAAGLRRWHGVELRAGDSTVAGRRLTASFEDEEPREVLEVIALALGAEMTMAGDTAVLRAATP